MEARRCEDLSIKYNLSILPYILFVRGSIFIVLWVNQYNGQRQMKSVLSRIRFPIFGLRPAPMSRDTIAPSGTSCRHVACWRSRDGVQPRYECHYAGLGRVKSAGNLAVRSNCPYVSFCILHGCHIKLSLRVLLCPTWLSDQTVLTCPSVSGKIVPHK